MDNPIKDLKNKIIDAHNNAIQEQKKREVTLQELESIAVKDRYRVIKPIQSIKRKKEIKKLKQDIAQYKKKKQTNIIVIGCICFFIVLAIIIGIESAIDKQTEQDTFDELIVSECTQQVDVVSVTQEEDFFLSEIITSEVSITEEASTHIHSFDVATCIHPMTCIICGEISGTVAEHIFLDGLCVNCDEKDPNYNEEYYVWVPTNGGSKYHSRPGCSNMKNPKEVILSDAISQGYGPCGRCF